MISKGAMAVVGTTVLALVSSAWMGAPPVADTSITVYRSPT